MKTVFKNYPIALLLSAFCPYLSIELGLRVDHLIIYPMFYLILVTYLMKPVELNKHLKPLLFIWISTFVFLAVRTALGSDATTFSDIFSEADNFMQPIALMLFFAYWSTDHIQDTLHKVSRFIVFLLCLNTVWIIVGLSTDVHYINEWFWRGTESVALKAEQMGRYSGIFNQPAEAGMAYSIGLIALTYVMTKAKRVNYKHAVSLMLLTFGGIVTISKIFLFGGLPLFLVAVMVNKEIRKQSLKLVAWVAVLFYAPYYYIANTWDGLFFLMRFVDGSNQRGVLNLLTAGRFGGEQSQQSSLFSEVWNQYPIYGAGFGKYQTVDTAFFHFFANGGMIALTVYIIMLMYLLHVSINFLKVCNYNSESKYFMFISIIVVIGSFGVPVFTLNRSSIILWMIMCMLLQYYFSVSKKTVHERSKLLLLKIKKSQPTI